MRLFPTICDQIHAAAAGRGLSGVVTRMTPEMANEFTAELGAPEGSLPFDVIGSRCVVIPDQEGCRAWSTWEG